MSQVTIVNLMDSENPKINQTDRVPPGAWAAIWPHHLYACWLMGLQNDRKNQENEGGGGNLRGANLSGAKNLLNATTWIDQFEKTKSGIVVYKRIGITQYNAPDYWKIKPGNYLTEVSNPLRTIDCGCGVNFGTLQWCNKNYTQADLWKCEIEWIDLTSVTVPYNTDGKARCERLRLIEKIK